MDVKHKKTALNDDSVLYQKRDASTNKQDIRNMNKKQRLQYFVDYYLLKVIAAIAVVALVGNLVYTTVFNRSETICSLSTIGNVYITETEAMSNDLYALFGLTGKKQYIGVANYDMDDYNQQMAFSTHLAAQDMDVVLCDEEQFLRYSEQGLFADLEDVLDPEIFSSLSDSIVNGSSTNYDLDGNVESVSEEYSMAIDITDSPVLSGYDTYCDGKIYAGIAYTTQRMDASTALLEYVATGDTSVFDTYAEKTVKAVQ